MCGAEPVPTSRLPGDSCTHTSRPVPALVFISVDLNLKHLFQHAAKLNLSLPPSRGRVPVPISSSTSLKPNIVSVFPISPSVSSRVPSCTRPGTSTNAVRRYPALSHQEFPSITGPRPSIAPSSRIYCHIPLINPPKINPFQYSKGYHHQHQASLCTIRRRRTFNPRLVIGNFISGVDFTTTKHDHTAARVGMLKVPKCLFRLDGLPAPTFMPSCVPVCPRLSAFSLQSRIFAI